MHVSSRRHERHSETVIEFSMAVTIAQIASSHHPSRQIKPTDRRSESLDRG